MEQLLVCPETIKHSSSHGRDETIQLEWSNAVTLRVRFRALAELDWIQGYIKPLANWPSVFLTPLKTGNARGSASTHFLFLYRILGILLTVSHSKLDCEAKYMILNGNGYTILKIYLCFSSVSVSMCAGPSRDKIRVFGSLGTGVTTFGSSLIRGVGAGVQSLARTMSVLNFSHFSNFKIDQTLKREWRRRKSYSYYNYVISRENCLITVWSLLRCRNLETQVWYFS